MQPINLTGLQVDLKSFQDQAAHMMEREPGQHNRHWALTFLQGEAHHCDAEQGTRSIMRAGKRVIRESAFSVFHEKYLGSPFHEFYKLVEETVGKIGRCRLLTLNSGQCYSFHADTELRIHVPIFTNYGSYLIIQNKGRDDQGKVIMPDLQLDMSEQTRVYHLPADGQSYMLNANHPHSAINGGPTVRAHLVLNLVNAVNDTVHA